MVPDLRALPVETNDEYWRAMIASGKPNSLMPAFAADQGGILTADQVKSLAAHLARTIPSKAIRPKVAKEPSRLK